MDALVPLLYLALAVTAGLFVLLVKKAAGLGLDRELQGLKRPADLSSLPSVTIVVPARNEQRNVEACIGSLLTFDYPRFEIILVDDESTDRTLELARALEANANGRLRILSSAGFPSEERKSWASGKSFVLWNAARQATGDILLFADCDTRHRPDGLWRAVSFMLAHRLPAFSASGTYLNPTLAGDLLETFMYTAVFLAMPLERINDPAESVGWLNGQFIMLRRESYLAAGGHQAIREFSFDDLSLGAHLKKVKVEYRFLPGAQLYRCDNYVGLREAFLGWRRLLVGTAWLGMGRAFFWEIGGVVLLTSVFPFFALALALALPESVPPLARTLAMAQCGLVTLLMAGNRAGMKTPAWRAILLPVAAILGLVSFVQGYRARFVSGQFEFRGRTHGASSEEATDRPAP